MRNSLLTLLLLSTSLLYSQGTYNKVGGVCFRIDDHQAAYKWRDFNAVFNKYGYKFSLALNTQRLLNDTAGYNALKEIIASGHELMEHTPSHTTAYIAYAPSSKQDTLWFTGKPGIDHINTSLSRICLTVDTFYTENYTVEGLVDVYGNTVISRNPGEFKDITYPVNYSCLNLPTINRLFTWYNVANKNPVDPDTLRIRTYWQEDVSLDTLLGVPYHRLSSTDIKMSEAAQRLLIERSLYVFDSLGFPRPKSWIQPGGSFAQYSKDEIQDFLAKDYGFTAAATYPSPSFKTYNEVDTLGNKRFALQNSDFSDENHTYQTIINTISDNSARHFTSFTLSHFNNPLGGWTGYIARIDTVLAWCKANNIPVYTFNEWASILFDSTPNPYVNIIPEFYRDLNKNGLPDGLNIGTGTVDSMNGVARSQGHSLVRTANGSFFSINNLGGFEKGWNRLTLYTKGSGAKDSVRIGIGYPEIPGSTRYYNLPANTPDWQEVCMNIYLEPKASRMSFQVIASRNVSAGSVQISGVQLRKLSRIKLNGDYNNRIFTNQFFGEINTDEFIIDSLYKNTEYETIVYPGNHVITTQDTVNGTITVKKPSLFWVGEDSLKIVTSNGDKTADSGYIHFKSEYPSVCYGESITLKGTLDYGINYTWQDGSLQVKADSIAVNPTVSSWYRVNYIALGGKPTTDSIYVRVDSIRPYITYTKDTTVCQGTDVFFSIPDSGEVTWLDANGKMLQNGTFYFVNPQKSLKLYIENAINACRVRDSLNITVSPVNIITQNHHTAYTKRGTNTGFSMRYPKGVHIVPLNTPINKFILLPDTVIFTADLSFLGKDSVIYLITDSICAYDTLQLNVIVQGTPFSVTGTTGGPDIIVYPNPANNELFIRTDINATVHVYSMVSNKVLEQALVPGDNRLDISLLANGIYLLKIETINGIITRYFVKQ